MTDTRHVEENLKTLSEKTVADFERRLREIGDDLEGMIESWERERPLTGVGDSVSSLTRARLAAEFRRVKVALTRLSDGGFGRCAQCARPIGKERLRADPAVRFCDRCALEGSEEQVLVPTRR